MKMVASREREQKLAKKGPGKFSGDHVCPVSSYRCVSPGVCFKANLIARGVSTHLSVNYALLKHLSSWLIIFSLADGLLFPNCVLQNDANDSDHARLFGHCQENKMVKLQADSL